jgi:hypothetical protein
MVRLPIVALSVNAGIAAMGHERSFRIIATGAASYDNEFSLGKTTAAISFYLIPTTIECPTVKASTRMLRNPALLIQPMQSAPE